MATAIEKLYVKKIVNKEINPSTEEEWKVDDVPIKWRTNVQEAILSQEENNVIIE